MGEIDDLVRIRLGIVEFEVVVPSQRLPILGLMVLGWGKIAREFVTAVVNPSVRTPFAEIHASARPRPAILRRIVE